MDHMTALLFSLGLIGLCNVLVVLVTRHMVNTIMCMHMCNDILDRDVHNNDIDEVIKKHD